MRRVFESLVLAVVVVFGFALAASAQPPGGGMGHPRGGQAGMGPGQEHVMDVMAKLNLTDAQKQQVHKLMMDAQAKNRDAMQQMMKLHEQLRDQIFADGGPSGDTSATAEQINKLQAQLMQSQIDLHVEVSKILDPAQRKMMREMPMPGMMGMGMMGGRGERPPAK